MARTVTIGDMRERVALYHRADARDELGGVVRGWTLYATVWARVSPASQGEQWRREQRQQTAGWTVVIRARDDVRATDRVVWRGRTFDVVGAAENADERGRFHKLACDERTDLPPSTADMDGGDGDETAAIISAGP